ncbi:uroporphyrinogen-III synthase [Cytobacillus eiseniae]|uniref:Uroporphyrinogen-III synthase n=1 Tax=Cytobacillus eiseniae TaxID=762947 RepID=A0ABS4RE15_9BACI|nr:uroporphyrinogen-III synthase [Cytobacillus eiseniae]MBP2240611.1 uroporphyrinogen-III synthase [Cytobacillus eiseniae]
MNASASPLKGKNVLVPRSRGQAKSFSELIKGYGGNPIEIPLIAFKPVHPSEEILAVIHQLHTYDWLIFTSSITVELFLSFVSPLERGKLPRIAAIGTKTASFIEAQGLRVDFVPEKYVAEEFVEDFLPHVKKGMKILIPKGSLARNYIATAFTAHGAIVDEIVIYETYFPEESKKLIVEELSRDKLHILTFTSPSTIDHLMSVVKEYNLYRHLEGCIIGCIGPVTKARIESYGLPVHSAPDVFTVNHMIKSIINYLENE